MKIKITPEVANSILTKGNRKIIISNLDKVEWIDLTNRTLFASHYGNGTIYNLEEVELFIYVLITKIHPSYYEISVHERINARTNIEINRKTGLTKYSKVGRFKAALNNVHTCEMFYNQPILFRKYFVRNLKIVEHITF